jgi:hypothetical protein
MTNGKPIGDKGKFVEIVKKQADGSWKCINDIWNSDHCLHPLLRNDNRGGSSSPPLFKLNTLHCGNRDCRAYGMFKFQHFFRDSSFPWMSPTLKFQMSTFQLKSQLFLSMRSSPDPYCESNYSA